MKVFGLGVAGSRPYPVWLRFVYVGLSLVYGVYFGDLLTEDRLDSDRHLTLSNSDRHHVYSVSVSVLEVKGFLYFVNFSE